jgi:pyruvate dehydrogenase E2 component (dihydrolipoamide acetyltransferase)
MANKKFLLPDLGEGLPDATIVEWFVKVGDTDALDDTLVSMETAKAVVEVPSPVSGKVLKLAGGDGDVIVTGTMLAEFEIDRRCRSAPKARTPAITTARSGPNPRRAAATHRRQRTTRSLRPTRAAHQRCGHAGAEGRTRAASATTPAPWSARCRVSDAVRRRPRVAVGGVKAMPAVRALARKLGVDLTRVGATGAEGAVTMDDVKRAAADGSAKAGCSADGAFTRTRCRAVAGDFAATLDPVRRRQADAHDSRLASPRPDSRNSSRGVRRNMARVMAEAHAQVVPTTLCDDADLHAWIGKQDITARLIRAIVAACKVVPALNAWFDGDKLMRTLHPHVDIGIAVDTDDGCSCRRCATPTCSTANGVRGAIQRLRAQVEDRSIPGIGIERLHDLAVELRHVRRPLRDAGGGAADRRDHRRRQAHARRVSR